MQHLPAPLKHNPLITVSSTYKPNIRTRIATAALITFGALTNTAPAQAAGGCYPNASAQVIESVLQGGGTLNQGAQAAAHESYYNGSDLCWLQIRGKAKQNKYAYPALRSAIN